MLWEAALVVAFLCTLFLTPLYAFGAWLSGRRSQPPEVSRIGWVVANTILLGAGVLHCAILVTGVFQAFTEGVEHRVFTAFTLLCLLAIFLLSASIIRRSLRPRVAASAELGMSAGLFGTSEFDSSLRWPEPAVEEPQERPGIPNRYR